MYGVTGVGRLDSYFLFREAPPCTGCPQPDFSIAMVDQSPSATTVLQYLTWVHGRSLNPPLDTVILPNMAIHPERGKDLSPAEDWQAAVSNTSDPAPLILWGGMVALSRLVVRNRRFVPWATCIAAAAERLGVRDSTIVTAGRRVEARLAKLAEEVRRHRPGESNRRLTPRPNILLRTVDEVNGSSAGDVAGGRFVTDGVLAEPIEQASGLIGLARGDILIDLAGKHPVAELWSAMVRTPLQYGGKARTPTWKVRQERCAAEAMQSWLMIALLQGALTEVTGRPSSSASLTDKADCDPLVLASNNLRWAIRRRLGVPYKYGEPCCDRNFPGNIDCLLNSNYLRAAPLPCGTPGCEARIPVRGGGFDCDALRFPSNPPATPGRVSCPREYPPSGVPEDWT